MRQSPKLCPECLAEFMPTVEVCSDCDVLLVHPDDIEEDDGDETLPPISELVPIRVASVQWIRGFSELLEDAGIAHRVGPPPEPDDDSDAERRSHDLHGMAIYVLADDQEEARLMDAEFLRSQIPDLDDDDNDSGDSNDDDEQVDEDGCPACGAPITAEDAECDSCGLPFIEVD